MNLANFYPGSWWSITFGIIICVVYGDNCVEPIHTLMGYDLKYRTV